MDFSKCQLILDPADKRLHEKCKKVKEPNAPMIFGLVKHMKDTQKAAGAIGLAANQIGVGLRIITAYHEGLDEIIEFINPRIFPLNEKDPESDIYWDHEGCLSHPGIVGEVARFRNLKVICHRLNFSGEIKLQASGMIARIIQHEMDHINGKLFTDLGIAVRNLEVIEAGQKKLQAITAQSAEEGQKDFVTE